MANNEIRVAWLSGSRSRRQELLTKIKAKIGEHEVIRIGEDATFDQLQQIVLSSDCLGTQKLVMVEALPQSSTSRATFVADIKKLIDRIPDDAFVLFYGIEPKDERAIFSYVEKNGKVFDLEDWITPDSAATLIKTTVTAAEKTIDDKDVLWIVYRLAPDADSPFDTRYHIDEIDLLMEKLLVFTGNRKVITHEDVLAVLSSERHVTVWNLLDVYDSSNFDEVHGIAHQLLATDPDVSSAVIGILNTSMWKFRLLMFLKEAEAAGYKGLDLIKAAAELQKMSHTGVGLNAVYTDEKQQAYNDRKIQDFAGMGYGAGSLCKYSRGKLLRIVEGLQTAIEQTRYLTEDAQFRLLLDTFLMLVCDQIDDSRRRRLSRYFEGCNEI